MGLAWDYTYAMGITDYPDSQNMQSCYDCRHLEVSGMSC